MINMLIYQGLPINHGDFKKWAMFKLSVIILYCLVDRVFPVIDYDV